MTKREKKLKRLLNNPKDVRLDEFLTLIGPYGYRYKSTRGSHIKVYSPKGKPESIPVHNNKIKKYYVIDILKTIHENS